MARHRVQDRRTLTVATRGAGKRMLRVGYVVVAPLWKASYRLTTPDTGVQVGPTMLAEDSSSNPAGVVDHVM